MTTPRTEAGRAHVWISNAAFTRIAGLAKVCMNCGLGLEKGERLLVTERTCPGRQPVKAEP